MKKMSRDVLKLARPFPIVGQISALAFSRETLNEKGAGLGGVDIALDLIPFVGRMKGLFEIFGGDLVNQENMKRGFATVRRAIDELERLCQIENQNSDDADGQGAEDTSSAGIEEHSERSNHPAAEDIAERFYPENSARLAMQRAKSATKRPYERRVYSGLQSDAQTPSDDQGCSI